MLKEQQNNRLMHCKLIVVIIILILEITKLTWEIYQHFSTYNCLPMLQNMLQKVIMIEGMKKERIEENMKIKYGKKNFN